MRRLFKLIKLIKLLLRHQTGHVKKRHQLAATAIHRAIYVHNVNLDKSFQMNLFRALYHLI